MKAARTLTLTLALVVSGAFVGSAGAQRGGGQPEPAPNPPQPVPVEAPRPVQPAPRPAPEAPRAVQPAPRPAPRPVAVAPEGQAQPAPRVAGQPINIKVDVTLTDESGGQNRTKTVSVVTADGLSSYIRTEALYDGPLGRVPLNIDAQPRILQGGKIQLLLNLQYDLPGFNVDKSAEHGALRSTTIRENLSLILEDGKRLTVAQAADPVGDRRVTVEVVAAIMR